MIRQVGEWLAWLVVALAACLALASGKAFGGTIGTEAAAPTAAQVARERVKALAQRPELEKQMKAAGIAPEEAGKRIDAMSDAEVLSLAGRLDQLPAGGAISNDQLIIVILLVVLIAILL